MQKTLAKNLRQTVLTKAGTSPPWMPLWWMLSVSTVQPVAIDTIAIVMP